jgi:hypothetical protein
LGMTDDNCMGCTGCKSLYESPKSGKIYCLITVLRDRACPCKICLVKLMCGKRCDDLDKFEEDILQEIERTRLINNRLYSYAKK